MCESCGAGKRLAHAKNVYPPPPTLKKRGVVWQRGSEEREAEAISGKILYVLLKILKGSKQENEWLKCLNSLHSARFDIGGPFGSGGTASSHMLMKFLRNMPERVCRESFRYFSVILCGVLFFLFPSDFQGIIDYIFYSKPQLNTLGILGPLDHHWLVENNISGCPHPLIPSDHFSLFAQLELLLPFLPQVNGIHLPGRRQSSTFRRRPQFHL